MLFTRWLLQPKHTFICQNPLSCGSNLPNPDCFTHFQIQTQFQFTKLHFLDVQTLPLQQACASKWIISLWVSNGVCRKCTKCCITERICRGHHMLLWLLLEGRLVWTGRLVWPCRLIRTEGVRLLLSHSWHLSRRCNNTTW